MLGLLIGAGIASVVLPQHVSIVPERLVISYQLRRAANQYGIDLGLLRSVVAVESNFDPLAVSRAGAIGLTQVMPFNARRCGLSVSELYLIRENLFCGAQILREELDRLGTTRKALAVYNCGKPTCKAGLRYAETVINTMKTRG